MSRRSVVDEPAFIYDWEAGVPLATMATTYGISDSTVSKIAQRMGLTSRRSRWPDRAPTNPVYALTGGQWVNTGGVMRWQRAVAPSA